ncbi:G-type lectin S-receptor-like serine/threonine-protein kinase [Tanacetum coccineum]|uniref:G-type lectin S-receptor-like serine/threonine-protein kinase n=1 Tax=Tanacetum coccineum TaxID=301880 RepID=A0ABQ4Y506_9ASTR
MLSVLLMLVSDSVLPPPKQPAFFTGDISQQLSSNSSANESSITQMYPSVLIGCNLKADTLLTPKQQSNLKLYAALYIKSVNHTIKDALDTISISQVIKDGETIVSSDDMYELGFFSPGKSKNRYLGIWFKKISKGTVVWVANRETPITDTSGMLKVSQEGNLAILNGGNDVIWSSNSAAPTRSKDVMVQLLDSGNLVVWDKNSTNPTPIWQSFDYPTDTLLAGMRFGKDLVTGLERYVTSWKSPDDPSIGMYKNWVETSGYPQIFGRKGPVILSRLGPWNGLGFSGFPIEISNTVYSTDFVVNQREIYNRYELTGSVVQRIVLTWDGRTQMLHWIERTQEWIVYADPGVDSCSSFEICGAYGSCSISKHPPCSCMEGFEPKFPQEWQSSDWSNGCQRKKPLDCGSEYEFREVSGVKLPDTRRSRYNYSMLLRECEMACRMDCSCTAYSNLDIRNGGSGCLLWFDELMDVREYDEDHNIYIKMPASELSEGHMVKKRIEVLIMILSTLSATLLLSAVVRFCWKRKKILYIKKQGELEYALDKKNTSVQKEHFGDIQFFSLYKVEKATENFSDSNKIGEGGFGPVYKGVLEDGLEVAVKRLSKTSKQGFDEFKNELISIAKLQHRNLVKLLGYCIYGDEMILIYEYMSNKSLDSFLFDDTRSSILNWPRRYHIIHGMARGILYLHQDSRLQIIHRDLKAANILLDSDMNPKISDFGLARKFVGHDTYAMTKKVVGTYGYISPEYAVHGRFSIKSDVFSFGVLVLEIVSGKKNREFFHEDHGDNLLGHAWRLYKEDRSIELICESIRDSCVISEVVRSIHVGLLCVQHLAKDRPTMLSVLLMLVSDSVLPPPKQPAFFTGDISQQLSSNSSANEYSITQLYPR